MSKSKHEPHEDNELADWFQKFYDDWKPYLPIIIGVVVIAVVGIGVGAWWFQSKRDSDAKVWQELSDARFRALNLSQTDGAVSTVGLKDFANLHQDTAAGKWATFQAGNMELSQGLIIVNSRLGEEGAKEKAKKNFEQAVELFEQVMADEKKLDKEILRRALFSMAVAQESLGNMTEAKNYYEQVMEFVGEDSSVYRVAQRGSVRCDQPELESFFQQFVSYVPKYGDAPGGQNLLPIIPNIDFPEPNTQAGGGDFQGPDDDLKTDVENKTAADVENKKDDVEKKKDESVNPPPEPPKSSDKKSDEKKKSDDDSKKSDGD